MINISYLKYLPLLSGEGPIQSINTIAENIFFDVEGFSTFTTLREDLHFNFEDPLVLYGKCDGQGISKSKNLSIVKSISESLERWAFYYNRAHHNSTYFFDYDNSTNGMAALAEPFPFHVRKIAYHEALERWCLAEFCSGKIGVNAYSIGMTGVVEFNCDLADQCSLIVYKKTEYGFIYGFSAKESRKKALESAYYEMFRNYKILKKFHDTNSSIVTNSVIEKRLIFFSTENGFNYFNELISECSLNKPRKPKLILDQEIVGEWSQYTKVWRTLFEYSDLDFLDKNKLMFFF